MQQGKRDESVDRTGSYGSLDKSLMHPESSVDDGWGPGPRPYTVFPRWPPTPSKRLEGGDFIMPAPDDIPSNEWT